MAKLQYIDFNTHAIESASKELSIYKQIGNHPKDIQFFEEAIRALTSEHLTLYIYKKNSQNQLDMSFSINNIVQTVNYSTVCRLYECGAYSSDYNFFESGGKAVFIGVDLFEAKRWRSDLEMSSSRADNLIEFYLSSNMHVSKVTLPANLPILQREKLVYCFEDFRGKI